MRSFPFHAIRDELYPHPRHFLETVVALKKLLNTAINDHLLVGALFHGSVTTDCHNCGSDLDLVILTRTGMFTPFNKYFCLAAAHIHPLVPLDIAYCSTEGLVSGCHPLTEQFAYTCVELCQDQRWFIGDVEYFCDALRAAQYRDPHAELCTFLSEKLQKVCALRLRIARDGIRPATIDSVSKTVLSSYRAVRLRFEAAHATLLPPALNLWEQLDTNRADHLKELEHCIEGEYPHEEAWNEELQSMFNHLEILENLIVSLIDALPQ
jgi:hypothetical protein